MNGQMKNKTKKRSPWFLKPVAALLLCFAFCGSGCVCLASVTATAEATGPADSVYVAGNPDQYPIEYYDRDAECYKGVLPELLAEISEKTGISFVYVGAGTKNRQEQLAKNRQVEMLTAIWEDDTDCGAASRFPVFHVTVQGKERSICIGFTDIIDDERKDSIVSAFSEIPESEKSERVLAFTLKSQPAGDRQIWIYAAVSGALAAVLTLIIVFAVLKKKKKEQKQSNMTDDLTGIGNRNYYTYSFDRLIPRQIKNLYYVAYLAFDAEKLRGLYGSEECDSIQKNAAVHLSTKTGPAESLSRTKNGVFAFAYQSDNKEAAEERIREILSSLGNYLAQFSKEYARIFAAGICCLAENPHCAAEAALDNARQGYLYAVKNTLPYAFSTEKLLSDTKKDEKLRLRVAKAVENNEFKPYLQFIVKADTGEICGAETLSRWQNPELGLMTPGEYIEVLQETGLILVHDYNVFDRVCHQLQEWSGTEYGDLFLSCNFTRLSLSSSDFSEQIKSIAGKYRFDHRNLMIEITEDTLTVDPLNSAKNISECNKMGFRIAIDDMGSGFSSLLDLYNNHIDFVKIDRHLVAEGTTHRGQKLLNGIISLAHSLDAKVICEGVTTEADAKMIQNTECDMIQGFYYSRVLPLDEGLRYLSRKPTSPV